MNSAGAGDAALRRLESELRQWTREQVGLVRDAHAAVIDGLAEKVSESDHLIQSDPLKWESFLSGSVE